MSGSTRGPATRATPPPERFDSGVPNLDRLLGSGLPRGAIVMDGRVEQLQRHVDLVA